MKFFMIPKAAGLPKKLVSTEALTKVALKERGLKGDPKDFIHEVPIDKDGLMNYINNLLSKDIPENANSTETKPGFIPPADVEIVVQNGVSVAVAPSNLTGHTTFSAKILDDQIEQLGEKGLPALELLESHQALTGIGGHFARGVILLCVLASGEHQLARLFHRKKVKGSL